MFCCAVAVIFGLIGRLVYLMVFDAKYYQKKAEALHEREREIKAARGEIVDAKGTVLATNKTVCTISVIHSQIKEPEKIVKALSAELGMEEDEVRKKVEKVSSMERIKTNVEKASGDRIREMELDEDFKRFYPYNELASKVLGFTGGDNQGIIGLEVKYEDYLKGKNGTILTTTDARGVELDGVAEDRIEPVAGNTLKVSLDYNIQMYAQQMAEKVMEEKQADKVGILLMNPQNGEILAMVSSPTYDPSLLVGRKRGANYKALVADFYKPLFDRALMGAYPPGSTFKPANGLILLQENIITPSTAYPCYHGFVSGGLKVGCHSHGSPLPLKPALQTSCNAYFCYGFKAMVDRRSKYGTSAEAFETWKKHLVSLGYGYRLGTDLPGESRGFIPNAKFYNKIYGEGRWSANTIISVSIGQGEILATPMQIANLCATIANRGWFITPHVVKEIEDTVMPQDLIARRYPTIDARHFADVAEGMRMAVTGGTCRLAALPDIEVAGKTGTAQNPHGKDHSAFIGFAPYDNPKIAVCAYVENAGFGATYGVPIGSLVIEKYLTGKISDQRKYLEQRMLESNTIIYSGVKKH